MLSSKLKLQADDLEQSLMKGEKLEDINCIGCTKSDRLLILFNNIISFKILFKSDFNCVVPVKISSQYFIKAQCRTKFDSKPYFVFLLGIIYS